MKNVMCDWYVLDTHFLEIALHVKSNVRLVVLCPFGGTLEEVHKYINDYQTNQVKKRLTWVPSEFIEENIFNNITYPQ